MMFKCRENSPKRCPNTSPKPSLNEQQPTPETDENTSVIALAVVAAIAVLVLIVLVGMIVFRRIRTRRLEKSSSQRPPQIQNRGDIKECLPSVTHDSEQRVRNQEEALGDDHTENIYNSIKEYDTEINHDYAQAVFTERNTDEDTKETISTDHTYKKLDEVPNGDCSKGYSHARMFGSLEDDDVKKEISGLGSYDYDKLSDRLSNKAVCESDIDYDHVGKIKDVEGEGNYDKLSGRPDNKAVCESDIDYDHVGKIKDVEGEGNYDKLSGRPDNKAVCESDIEYDHVGKIKDVEGEGN